MRILFTKTEGAVWNPLHIHSIDKQGLLSLLTDGIGDIAVLRDRNYTILKDVNTSDTIKPDTIIEKNLRFHSLMVESGTIFDSYFYYEKRNGGLDYSFYQYRNFGLPAKRFEELWKDVSVRAHELWIAEKIKKRDEEAEKERKKRKRKKKK